MNMFLALVLGTGLLLGGCATSGPRVQTIAGTTIEPLGPAADDLIVLVFGSPDCPIANAIAPELERLHEHTQAVGGAWRVGRWRKNVAASGGISLGHSRRGGPCS